MICDDHAEFRQAIGVLLSRDPDIEVVGEAVDGRDAIRIVGQLRPDVLLLDIAMPVMDGLEALPHIRESSPETQVVMFTGVVAESVKQRALEGGACLFIEKGTDGEVVAGQIKDVCRQPLQV